MTCMAIEAVGYFLLLLLVEYLWVSVAGDSIRHILSWMNSYIRCCGRKKKHDGSDNDDSVKDIQEDVDVATERERVESGAVDEDPTTVLSIKGLRKVYPQLGVPKVAVHGMHLGISKGTCFGLLGVNGAGKTTTFSMLT